MKCLTDYYKTMMPNVFLGIAAAAVVGSIFIEFPAARRHREAHQNWLRHEEDLDELNQARIEIAKARQREKK